MEITTQQVTTEKNRRPRRRLITGMAATLGAAFLLMSVACGAAAPESTPQVIEREVAREAPAPVQPAAQSQPAAPAQQQSQPASVPSQSQSSAPAAQSQPASQESAPASAASQGVQSEQGDTASTAPRQAPSTTTTGCLVG